MVDRIAPALVGIVLLLATLGIAVGYLRTVLGPVRASRVTRLGRTGVRIVRTGVRVTGGAIRLLYRTTRWIIRGPSARHRKIQKPPAQTMIRLRRHQP